MNPARPHHLLRHRCRDCDEELHPNTPVLVRLGRCARCGALLHGVYLRQMLFLSLVGIGIVAAAAYMLRRL